MTYISHTSLGMKGTSTMPAARESEDGRWLKVQVRKHQALKEKLATNRNQKLNSVSKCIRDFISPRN